MQKSIKFDVNGASASLSEADSQVDKLHPRPLSCWIIGPARLSCFYIRSRTLARPMA